MAESTLTLTRLELKNHIGQYLGISRTIADWAADANIVADVDRIVEYGERQFFEPNFSRQGPNASVKTHVWSFLSPTLSITTTNGASSYTLPDDFAGFLDTELAGSLDREWPVLLVPLWRVLEKRQNGSTMPTGITQPLLAAVMPKTFTASTGQRWLVEMWPTPVTGSLPVVSGRYRSNPSTIADDAHYPLGGEPHAQTLLESCLAAAETLMNDQSSVHRERFAELLAASIALDMRLHSQEAA